MSCSDYHEMQQEIDECHSLISELYQILGQFMDEIPTVVLDKMCSKLNDDFYNGLWYDEYPSLLPWYRAQEEKGSDNEP